MSWDNDEVWLLVVKSWEPVMFWPVPMSIPVYAIIKIHVSLNGVETHCFVKWDIFHFEVHSNVSTWRTINQNCSQCSILQLCWYPNPVWDLKTRGECLCIIARKSFAYNFIQRNLWRYVAQVLVYFLLKCRSVLKFCSIGGKWLLKRFEGQN